MRSNRKEAHVQDAEGFAVIWRNAQRARSELLGGWLVRLVSRLSTLSHADWFKLGAPALPFAERGNPGGSPEATRRAFNKRFLLDLAEDWQQHGREVFKRVRRESPASYLKVCAMLVPREMKLEHSGGVKAMTDEEIERSIELIKAMIAERDAGANAKVIEGEAEVVPSLPAPARPTKAS
jgi:hypothetical protein